jgi:hypothetical protein
MALFPKTSGLFFDDRMWLQKRTLFFSKLQSLFPENDALFHTDVNNLIANLVVQSLEKQAKGHTDFIALPGLNTAEHVTGYMIEGVWGPETNSVDVKGLKAFFPQNNLDRIIAIVPVTYYVPRLGEGHGIEVVLFNRHMFFSCCYAVLVFAKSKQSYKKIYGSIKQVYVHSKKVNQVKIDKRRYSKENANDYYSVLPEGLIPHIIEQCMGIVSNKNLDNIFLKPKTPYFYCCSH